MVKEGYVPVHDMKACRESVCVCIVPLILYRGGR
jgi:hypothetical protein